MSRGWITDDASMTNMQHYVVVQYSFVVAFAGKHTILYLFVKKRAHKIEYLLKRINLNQMQQEKFK